MGWKEKILSLTCHQVALFFAVIELLHLAISRVYLCFYDGASLSSITTITIGDEKRDVIADLNFEKDVRGDILQATVSILLIVGIIKKLKWLHVPWMIHALVQVCFTLVVTVMFIIWLYKWPSENENKTKIAAILSFYAFFSIKFKMVAAVAVVRSFRKIREAGRLSLGFVEKKTQCASSC